jgi:hypothetical protein
MRVAEKLDWKELKCDVNLCKEETILYQNGNMKRKVGAQFKMFYA